MSQIDLILRELMELDPTFREHEPAVRSIVARLIAEKPSATIDEAFVLRLRQEIQREASRPVTQNTSWWKQPTWVSGFALSGVAIVLILVTAVVLLPGQGTTPGATLAISTKPTIRHLADLGFGNFAQVNVNAPTAMGSAGGSPERAQSGGGGVASSAPGGDRMMGSMIAPDGNTVTITYDYPEETLPEFPATANVYRRVRTSLAPQFSGLVNGIDLALLKLRSFAGLTLTRLEFADSAAPGYSIFADLVNGEISINTANYPYSIMPVRFDNNSSANMSDAEALQLAKSFLDLHGVDISGFGDPIVIRPEVFAGGESGSWLAVRYPLVVDGMKVYEYGGDPVGLNVSLDAGQRRVESVYGLAQYNYESSSYPLVQDAKRIIAAAERGYFGPQIYYLENQNRNEERTYQLGQPELVLYRNWQHDPATMQSVEYLVPALMFPVLDRTTSSDSWMVQKNIVVPITAEVLDQLEKPADVRIMNEPAQTPVDVVVPKQ